MNDSVAPVPRLLRIRELEALTGIAKWRWYEMLRKGEGPPCLKIGRTFACPEDQLRRWIQEQSTKKE